MAAILLSEKYQADLDGVLNCYDRIIISGNVHPLCYAKGMTRYLYTNNIRIFDYPEFAQRLRDDIRSNAETVAKEHGLQIEFIRKGNSFRKADRIREILKTRGDHPGLVHIFSAALPITRGTTSKLTRRSSRAGKANACITTSTSLTRTWACVTSAFLPGVRSACNSTSMATTGWPSS